MRGTGDNHNEASRLFRSNSRRIPSCCPLAAYKNRTLLPGATANNMPRRPQSTRMVPGLLLCSEFSVETGMIKVIEMAESQQVTSLMGQNSTRLAYLVSKFPTITEAWI